MASTNAAISRLEVAAQPRDGGELQLVGDLVQADPEPEVGRVDAELPLGRHDVRRDQQQPAAGAEDLVLARAPGEERKASRPPAWTPVAREPMAVASGPGRLPCFSVSASTSGSSSAAMPLVLASTQPGRSTTATSGTGPPGTGLHAGQLLDVRDGDGGGLVQLADDGGGLLAGRLRARR